MEVMNKQLSQVLEFHEKFSVPVGQEPRLLKEARSRLRHSFMAEEVEEYIEGVESKDLSNIAKELADIIYVTYGTVIEHGLQDSFDEVFSEVHRSNMTKEYASLKVKKGEGYKEPNIDKFFAKNW